MSDKVIHQGIIVKLFPTISLKHFNFTVKHSQPIFEKHKNAEKLHICVSWDQSKQIVYSHQQTQHNSDNLN